MRSLFILGSGRSGTSLVAGLFVRAGFYAGDQLHPPQPANPTGYFESLEINRLNEDIILRMPHRPPPRRRWVWPWRRPAPIRLRQLWLAVAPLEAEPAAPAEVEARVRALTARRPFVLKDPRFCYTLPVWRAAAPDAAGVCVFRAPEDTVASMLANCRTSPFYRDLAVNGSVAREVWTTMYRHVLEKHRRAGDWLFVHYHQVLDGAGIGRLEEIGGARLDRSFAEPALNRARGRRLASPEAEAVYGELCRLAGYDPRR